MDRFFLQPAIPGRHLMELRLTFSTGLMTGEGRDWVGAFVLRGRYDLADGKCHWIKHYVGEHDVFFKGFNEGKGIWGTWDIPGTDAYPSRAAASTSGRKGWRIRPALTWRKKPICRYSSAKSWNPFRSWSDFSRKRGSCSGHDAAASFVPQQEADQRLGVADGAVQRPVQGLAVGNDQWFQAFVGLRATGAGRQPAGQEEEHALVHDARRRVELGQLVPASGAVAGFFFQLPHGGRLDGLGRLQRPGRQLDQRLADAGTVVAEEADALSVEPGQDGHGAGVQDHLALGRPPPASSCSSTASWILLPVNTILRGRGCRSWPGPSPRLLPASFRERPALRLLGVRTDDKIFCTWLQRFPRPESSCDA